ncbi:diguanylate cyclase [Legionella hackeliae]|uniref:diguanylate cyclase n=1 Tax=Legionella hackeliae TaxID=449 RepID=A0A0A8USU3_LEGHA|nr:diguanylate cyclase [Legionella hackeliae]KTD13870.1 regulatory protein (GGDEF, PAS, PAC domains) [Legionella hackeliae]CEK10571.1 Diguanylate kinase [Legionella hackeliae]STX47311.1 Diguanylate kinase [Legionella hackeliae]
MLLTTPSLSYDELRQMICHIDQAIYNHQQWYNAIIRTLICHLPASAIDLSKNAYKDCRFGQWYYSDLPRGIQNYQGFASIGDSHKRMHELATHLLQITDSGKKVTPVSYDRFANALEQMRLEVFTLKNEIEFLMYNRDMLTGAITRLNMLPILIEQQELIKRQGKSCCLAMIDIDRFKDINDNYGHLAGDGVLAEIANYIIQNTRPYDKLFRYGGEEFLLCLPFTELTEGQKMLERLCKGIENMDFKFKNKTLVPFTVSAGLGLLDPFLPAAVSIEQADKAMYAAKQAGRNCVYVYPDSC